MDCDMLVLDDIAKLWELRDERYAVQVVKHDHVPKEDVKFLGEMQTKYEKKNWSSVMLINCARCTRAHARVREQRERPRAAPCRQRRRPAPRHLSSATPLPRSPRRPPSLPLPPGDAQRHFTAEVTQNVTL